MKVLLFFSALLKVTCGSDLFQHNSNLQNVDQSLISGGKAIRNQFPYQISLQKSVAESEYIHTCSGALLSLTWATTTAYCVTPSDMNFRVVAGMVNKNLPDIDLQIGTIKKIVVHPEYQGDISHSDIALIQLESSLFFTKAVQPISPSVDEDNWGASMLSSWKVQTQLFKSFSFNQLYYMIVYISTTEKCKSTLGQGYNFSEKVLCTEKMSQALFCPGESGSPLVSNGYLVGLTSWGFAPCGVTVYTKINYFLNFIITHVTDL